MTDTAYTAEQIERRIVAALADLLGVTPGAVDLDQPLASHGLVSVEMVGLVGSLEQWLGRELPATLFWEYPTIRAVSAYLADGPAATAAPSWMPGAAPTTRHRTDDGDDAVAIVGIGCRFPGGADSAAQLWQLLATGRDAIDRVPDDRWDAERYLSDDPAVPGHGSTPWGGFLRGIDEFDHVFFGISPREAQHMDPQQRLVAEVTWEALDDAGIPVDSLAGTDTGVFVGIANGDYGHRAFHLLDQIDAYSGTGNAMSIAANRLSYLLDTHGPSLALDTACSSSLVAVATAVESITRGECAMAVAAGVNLILSPALMINFSKAGAMAKDGRCKAFDARADGYVRSEGVAAVILKPVADAVRDGDRVYAVIRGHAVNQDGRTNGLMAPNPHAQTAVVRAAWARAGLDPSGAAYVEAHGTGTMLGDPLEARALAAVVGVGRDPQAACLVGSIKSNIGHTEAAAGIAGLLKVALALHHRWIPPTLHFQTPNPNIDFAELGLDVADTGRPWPQGAALHAGVSSFGFGGTNAHVVLSGAPEPAAAASAGPDPGAARRPAAAGTLLLPLSARTRAALQARARQLAELLAEAQTDRALDICRTAAVRRGHFEHRLVARGPDGAAVSAALARAAEGAQEAVVCGRVRLSPGARVAFVFAGQGPRWWPVADDVLAHPVVRAQLDACARVLADLVPWQLDEVLRGMSAHDPNRPSVGQPALCALQLALARLWRSLDVHPDVVVGHSLGEVAAAHLAGALTLDEVLRIAVARGAAVEEHAGGGMASVEAPVDLVERVLRDEKVDQVYVAAVNGPRSVVLSGDRHQLEQVAAACERADVSCRVLAAVAFASHSPFMDAAAASLGERLGELIPSPARVPLLSTSDPTPEPVPGHRLTGDYWSANLRQPVRFEGAVHRLAADGVRVFVEISGHPSLVHPLQACVAELGDETVVVSSLRVGAGLGTLLDGLGTLHCAGVSLDWGGVFGRPAEPASLPAYPWQRTRHWLEDTGAAPDGDAHPALGGYTLTATLGRHVWTAPITTTRMPYLGDHVVGGAPILPAAFLLDASLAAARTVLDGGDGPVVVSELGLDRPVHVESATAIPTLQVAVDGGGGHSRGLVLASRPAGDDPALPWEIVGRAVVHRAAVPTPLPDLVPARERCRHEVDVAAMYAALASAGLAYGPAFRGIETAWSGIGEALARLHPRRELVHDAAAYAVHPVLLDAALQVVAAAVPQTRGTATWVPVGCAEFRLAEGPAEPQWVHVRLPGEVAPDTTEIRADIELFDAQEHWVGRVGGLRLHLLDAGDTAAACEVFDTAWAPATAVPVGPQRHGWWLVLADAQGCGAAVRDAVQHTDPVVLVHRDGPDRAAPSGALVADPARRGHLTQVLTGAAADHGGWGACLGVIYGWALDCPVEEADLTGRDVVATTVAAAVDPLRRLVSTLTGLPADAPPPPPVVVLTRGAQTLPGDRQVAGVAQAAQWGFARVLAVEHPELSVRLLDLDPVTHRHDVAAVLDCAHGPQRDLAHRDGRWWTPTVTHVPAVLEAATVTRTWDRSHSWAFRLRVDEPGILDSTRAVRCSRAAPERGWVEIAVGAAGVNFSDVLKAMGRYPGVGEDPPLGAECAGTIVRVGPGVEGLAVGDPVVAIADRTAAAYVQAPAALVVRRPSTLPEEVAATLPIAFLTARIALEELARLRPGESVLVHSATGGVGAAAIQVARRVGARILATAGTPEKRAALREEGIGDVFDSRTTDFVQGVRTATAGLGVDVVLNSLSGPALVGGMQALAPHGRMVEIGKTDIYAGSPLDLGLLRDNRSVLTLDLAHVCATDAERVGRLLRETVALVADGSLAPPAVTVFPVDRAGQALALLSRAGHRGKLVLRADGPVQVAAPDALAVDPTGSYLVTGGLGVVGRVLADALIAGGAKTIVLMSRHAPGPEASRWLADRAPEVDVRVLAGDVGDDVSLRSVLATIDASAPPLRGVVHAAGVLDDRAALDTDPESMATVGGPKLAGAWNLDRLTRDRELPLFVLLSSAAGLLGSAGQANYAAANSGVHAVAAARRAAGLPALSIAYGPWADGGLAAGAVARGLLTRLGIGPITAAEGVAGLATSLGLSSRPAHTLVMRLDRARMRAADESGLLPAVLQGVAGQLAERPSDDLGLRSELLAAPPGHRRLRVLIEHLREQAAYVLRVPLDDVDPHAPLATMGFDSLMSLELRKRLERTTGVTLSATLAWRHPSLAEMAPHVAAVMGVPLDAADPAIPTGLASQSGTVAGIGGASPAAPDQAADSAAPAAARAASAADVGAAEAWLDRSSSAGSDVSSLSGDELATAFLSKLTELEESLSGAAAVPS
ncbi:MAG: SDR family NAD(P)-dependent oxidoreductase [Dermatophilaceae bacterium]